MHVQDHHTLDQLRLFERREKDAGASKRLRIVILAAEGWTAPAVAKAVGFSRRACQGGLARYNESGLDGLRDGRGADPKLPLSDEQQQAVRRRVEAGPTEADGVCSLRGKDFRRILEAEFGLTRSLSGVYWLLHRLGYSYLRPRPRHQKNDPEAMAAFKASWPERVAAIAEQHPGKRLRVYFQDESRFGQQGTNTNVWAERGSRPTAVRQTEYKNLWVLGAVCPPCEENADRPRRGTAEPLVEHEGGEHLPGAVLREDPRGRTRGDGLGPGSNQTAAGFHTWKGLAMPSTITAVRLPAYSPELNPMENLWHFLKSHYWSNRAYEDYEALEEAAMRAWQTAALDEELMKTVCAAPYTDRAASD